MSERFAYAAMLFFCLAATLPWTPVLGLRQLYQWRRLLLTVVLAGTPFLIWDLYATHTDQWWFDPRQTLPWRIAGLPLEEIAFFIVIPVVSVFTFEAVGSTLRRIGGRAGTRDDGPHERTGTP